MDNKIKKIFLYIITLSPLIDVLFIINSEYLNISFPIHQIIRGIILLLNVFYIFKFKEYKIFLVLCILLLINEIVYFFSYGLINISNNFSYILKILYTISFIQTYYILLKEKILDENSIISCMSKASLIISLIILFSKITNIGLQSYAKTASYRSGVKGLFYAHNSITATLLILLPICVYIFYKKKTIYSFFNIIINILALNLLGTKMGIIGCLFIIFWTFLFFIIEYIKENKIERKKVYIVCGLVLLSLIVLIFISKNYFINIYEQQKEIYIKYKYENIFSYLISNRDLQINYLKTYIYENGINILSFIFGLGYTKANSIIHTGKSAFKVVEMDFSGLFYYSGVFVLLAVIFIIIRSIYKYFNINSLKNTNYYKKIILLSFIIAIIHSSLGGHVIYEAITGTYFGVILALIRFSYKDPNMDVEGKNKEI